MRVISGTARSIQLVTQKSSLTRPTTDRIKETLFNIIHFDIVGSTFLDLFSGSGAIGIEALSRGADRAVFIENNCDALACINENLKKTKLLNKATIIEGDVLTKLKELGAKGEKFNIIFMDPPYKEGLVYKTLALINQESLLANEGFIIVEHGSDEVIDPLGYKVFKQKQYKTTVMTFLSQEE